MDGAAETAGGKRYAAFISYSHAQSRFAERLQWRLETYVPPKALADFQITDRQGRVAPIYRDREELAASASLSDDIRKALENSAFLIVIASPDAAGSNWVEEEVSYFLQIADRARILVAIPPDSDATNIASILPKTLRGGEPLAADFRKDGDGETAALLRLVAAISGADFARLRDRDGRRQRTRFLIGAAFAVVISAVAGALGFQALSQIQLAQLGEDTERERADIALAHRFAERAEDEYAQGRLKRALRYALAGYALRPDLADVFRDELARILYVPTAFESARIFPENTPVMAYRDGEAFVIYPADRGSNQLAFYDPGTRRVRQTSAINWGDPLGDHVPEQLVPGTWRFTGEAPCQLQTSPELEITSLGDDENVVFALRPAGLGAVTPDCSLVAVLNETGAGFYRVRDAREIGTAAFQGEVKAMALAPDSAHPALTLVVANAGDASLCRVVTLTPRTRVESEEIGCGEAVPRISFGRDRRTALIVSGEELTIAGEEPRILPLYGADLQFDLSADRRSLLQCSGSGQFEIYDLEASRQTFGGHAPITGLQACGFSGATGNEVTAISSDGRAYHVVLAPNHLHQSFRAGVGGDVEMLLRPMAFAGDVIFGEADEAEQFWRVADRIQERRDPDDFGEVKLDDPIGPRNPTLRTYGVLNADTSAVVTLTRYSGGGFDMRRRDGSLAGRLRNYDGELQSAHLSSASRWVVVSSEDGSVTVWDVGTGALVKRIACVRGAKLAAFLDDETILIADGSSALHVVAWREDVVRSTRRVGFQPLHVAVSLDRQAIALVGDAGTVTLFASRDLSEVAGARVSDSSLNWVSFNADGSRLVAVGGDVAVVLGRSRLSVLARMDGEGSAVFSGDGRFLAIGGMNIMSVLDVAQLNEPLGRLVAAACASLGDEDRFSDDEIAADDLVRTNWREHGQRRLCAAAR